MLILPLKELPAGLDVARPVAWCGPGWEASSGADRMLETPTEPLQQGADEITAGIAAGGTVGDR